MGRAPSLALLITLAAVVVAVVPAATAATSARAADEPIAVRGPANGSVWPVTSTILLEAHTPWYCATCNGTERLVVATDPAMSKVVWQADGPCEPATEPTCPTYTVAGPFSPGTYYWRVDASFDDGSTHQTDVWSFTVTARGSGSSTFSDATGDSKGAPDVTSVQVSATGGRLIRIAASIPGLTRLASDENVWIAIDSDQNGNTGARGFGADYLFRLNGKTGHYGFWRREADAWIYAVTSSTWIWYGSGGVVATFDRDSIGGEKTTGFNFWVETLKGDGETGTGTWEYAPDASVWNVQLLPAAPATPTIVAIPVRTVPAAPVAGAVFRIRVPSLTLSSGRHPAPDSVTCRAFIAGRALASAGPCTFRIPATGAGKRLVLRVTATYVDVIKTRTLTFVIRRPA